MKIAISSLARNKRTTSSTFKLLLKSNNNNKTFNITGNETKRTFIQSTILNNNNENINKNEEEKIKNNNEESSFSTEAKVFEKIVLDRKTTKFFDPNRPVPIDVLNHILALTQRAPTGFNLQPWTAVVVTNPEKKKELYKASLSQNKVIEAPVVVVFGANHNVLDNRDKVFQTSIKTGNFSEDYAKSAYISTTAMLNTGPLCLFQLAKYAVTSIYGLFNPILVPPVNMKAYAWKQAIFPVQNFVLAATSHGLSTCIMEGIDETRVRQVVGLPNNYSIPVIVALGYPTDHPINNLPRTSRLAPEEQFFDNSYPTPRHERLLIALYGTPGVGKTTVSNYLQKCFTNDLNSSCAIIPMDGFHYYKRELNQMDDPDYAFLRRGAPFTFNDKAFETLLKRVKYCTNEVIKAPSFDHHIGDPIEEDIIIQKEDNIIIVEGNYLATWKNVSSLFDVFIYLHTETKEEAMERVVKRHMKTGLTEEQARKRIETNDGINADEIVKDHQQLKATTTIDKPIFEILSIHDNNTL
ncbi:hypothetical protein ABK040_001148 [Willaertia magna]